MIKTVDTGMRRRRRCEKHNLDLNCDQPDLIPSLDTFPVTPITPPAAFLPLGYKRPSTKGKGEICTVNHDADVKYRENNKSISKQRNIFQCQI